MAEWTERETVVGGNPERMTKHTSACSCSPLETSLCVWRVMSLSGGFVLFIYFQHFQHHPFSAFNAADRDKLLGSYYVQLAHAACDLMTLESMTKQHSRE